LKEVIREDKNVICVGFAMDALNRLANLRPEDEEALPLVIDLQKNLPEILEGSPLQSWEALVRGGLNVGTLSDYQLPSQ
jgi:hypothetical protein